jgi:hypothetical protein
VFHRAPVALMLNDASTIAALVGQLRRDGTPTSRPISMPIKPVAQLHQDFGRRHLEPHGPEQHHEQVEVGHAGRLAEQSVGREPVGQSPALSGRTTCGDGRYAGERKIST